MKVDMHRLLERDPHEGQRMLGALRFADLAAFREALAELCLLPSHLPSSRRGSWWSFVRREFARDAAEIPEAAAAQFFIRLWEAHRDGERRRRIEASAKGRRTLKDRGGKLFRAYPKKKAAPP